MLLLINSNDPESQMLLNELDSKPPVRNLEILRIDIERYRKFVERSWGVTYIPCLKIDDNLIEGKKYIMRYLFPPASPEFQKLNSATFTETSINVGNSDSEFGIPGGGGPSGGILESPDANLNITYSQNQDFNRMKAQASEFLEL